MPPISICFHLPQDLFSAARAHGGPQASLRQAVDDRLPDIAEAASGAEIRPRLYLRAGEEPENMFPRMIETLVHRIIAVVGAQDQQVVFLHGRAARRD